MLWPRPDSDSRGSQIWVQLLLLPPSTSVFLFKLPYSKSGFLIWKRGTILASIYWLPIMCQALFPLKAMPFNCHNKNPTRQVPLSCHFTDEETKAQHPHGNWQRGVGAQSLHRQVSRTASLISELLCFSSGNYSDSLQHPCWSIVPRRK